MNNASFTSTLVKEFELRFQPSNFQDVNHHQSTITLSLLNKKLIICRISGPFPYLIIHIMKYLIVLTGVF